MKIILPALVLLVLMCSCNKDRPANTNGTPSNTAVSVRYYRPADHRYTTDSFVLDANNRLIKFIRLSVDSTGPSTGQGEYDFTYSGSDTIPTSYTFVNLNELHILQYDGQGKILKDSSTQVQNTFDFAYTASEVILTQTLSPQIGSFVDTMTIVNGNIAERRYWQFAPQPTGTGFADLRYTYSPIANPLHFPGNVGLLLFEISGQLDYLSENLYDHSSSGTAVDNITWSTDANGRATIGDETFIANGNTTIQQTTYRYE